jgi:superoxide dismutase, Cu-Zn family
MNCFPAASFLAALFLSTAAFAQSDEPLTAKATLKGADGADMGTVTLTEAAAGGVLLSAELTGLPPGPHGFHIHETGTCEPPFESAGGHYNPTGAEHGFLAVGGPHAGDMPNIHVPDSGALTVDVLNTLVSLEEGAPETLFDDDGSAILVHADADDYQGQPSGHAGDRIACGVIER